jgi:hypothetical protein
MSQGIFVKVFAGLTPWLISTNKKTAPPEVTDLEEYGITFLFIPFLRWSYPDQVQGVSLKIGTLRPSLPQGNFSISFTGAMCQADTKRGPGV